ncbi:hypothetical protein Cs7R123_69420 [Catellatospora sp. TT07R-123]|uniref:hypothetical protein n=1 Tax=Catellatospora sp. TT07R-123 TaxID=2733863 RepID=UPI001B03BA1D|nr:hypothetical protein [Catellatospora sp. TT07R-123]GHJ49600.1 hypothetical protein Cs7R123_69420 [Catellatospora sp. TT07R-123]
MRTTLIRAALGLGLAALTAACAGTAGADADPTPPPSAAASPSLSPSLEAAAPGRAPELKAFTANLPQVPDPWWKVQEAQVSGDHAFLPYTRPGGPDVVFDAEVMAAPAEPSAYRGQTPVATVRLGSYTGYVYPLPSGTYEVRWRVGDLLYRMVGQPSEGQKLSLDQFKTLIGQLAWA